MANKYHARESCMNCKANIYNVWDLFCSRGCRRTYIRKRKKRGESDVESRLRSLMQAKAQAELRKVNAHGNS